MHFLYIKYIHNMLVYLLHKKSAVRIKKKPLSRNLIEKMVAIQYTRKVKFCSSSLLLLLFYFSLLLHLLLLLQFFFISSSLVYIYMYIERDVLFVFYYYYYYSSSISFFVSFTTQGAHMCNIF